MFGHERSGRRSTLPKPTINSAPHILFDTNFFVRIFHLLLMEMIHDRCSIHLTEFGTALTTSLPILFQYCYKYCYSDSRNLGAVMKAGGLEL